MKKLILAALLPLLLAACGKSLEGTYVEPETGVSVTFDGDYLQVTGNPLQKYEIDGDKIIVDTGMGKNVYFIIQDAQHLKFAPVGVIFKKK